MRYLMALAAGCALSLLVAASVALAGPREDCAGGQQNPDLAIQACSKLIKRAPRDASLFVDRGNASYYKRDYDRAIADYAEAIRLNPGNVVAYGNRAKCY